MVVMISLSNFAKSLQNQWEAAATYVPENEDSVWQAVFSGICREISEAHGLVDIWVRSSGYDLARDRIEKETFERCFSRIKASLPYLQIRSVIATMIAVYECDPSLVRERDRNDLLRLLRSRLPGGEDFHLVDWTSIHNELHVRMRALPQLSKCCVPISDVSKSEMNKLSVVAFDVLTTKERTLMLYFNNDEDMIFAKLRLS